MDIKKLSLKDFNNFDNLLRNTDYINDLTIILSDELESFKVIKDQDDYHNDMFTASNYQHLEPLLITLINTISDLNDKNMIALQQLKTKKDR